MARASSFGGGVESMLSAADKALRRTGITSSDSYVIADVSPFADKTIHDVWLSKMGYDPPPISAEKARTFRLGHLVEQSALQLLAEERGLIIAPGSTEKHPFLPWVISSPDGNVFMNKVAEGCYGNTGHETNQRIAVAEAKNVGAHMIDRWGTSSNPTIPDEVVVQCTWHCIMTRTRIAYVVAVLSGDYRTYVLEQDQDLAGELLQLCEGFYTNYVVPKVQPVNDGSGGAARMIKALFKRNRFEMLPATPTAEALAKEFSEARRIEKEAKARKEAAQTKMCGL